PPRKVYRRFLHEQVSFRTDLSLVSTSIPAGNLEDLSLTFENMRAWLPVTKYLLGERLGTILVASQGREGKLEVISGFSVKEIGRLQPNDLCKLSCEEKYQQDTNPE